jgi:hypothetical protein
MADVTTLRTSSLALVVLTVLASCLLRAQTPANRRQRFTTAFTITEL